jgi:hypothetical protein
LAANQSDISGHPPVLDATSRTLSTVGDAITESVHVTIDPPDIGSGGQFSGTNGAHTGRPVAFPEADDLAKRFAQAQQDVVGGVHDYAKAVATMGTTLSNIATTYDQAAQADQVGAQQVQQAIDAATKPAA